MKGPWNSEIMFTLDVIKLSEKSFLFIYLFLFTIHIYIYIYIYTLTTED